MSSSVQPDMPASDFFRTLDTQITPHVDTHRVLVILSGGEVLVRPTWTGSGWSSTAASIRGAW